MNTFGIEVGSITLLMIGLGFVWVIYGERYLGHLWWPYFMGVGIILVIASLFISSAWGSVLVGIIGGSFIWGATEFKEQAVRAEIGWFTFNSKKIKPPFEHIIKTWKAPHL
jgi:uncharacterized membrane protein YdbT with pleckstrin-like domain